MGQGRDLAGRVAALETRVRRDQARWVRRRVKWLVGADRPVETTIEVPCFTLDDWCRRPSIDPELVHYVKLDTQLRRRHIAWQIEIAPDFLSSISTRRPSAPACAARTNWAHRLDT